MRRSTSGYAARLAAQLARYLLPASLLVLFAAACELPSLRSIADVQGKDHVSPVVGDLVTVRGVVVARGSLMLAIPGREGREGEVRRRAVCWIEEQDDGDPATSRGLLVVGASAEVGRQVRATGEVVEWQEDPERDDLSVTALVTTELVDEGDGLTPEPVLLGPSGRSLPGTQVDDDGLTRFEPDTDGLDFWESLEGMRVRVPDAVVVGPTKRGIVHVVAENGEGAGPRTAAGGLLLTEGDANPERIQLSPQLLARGVQVPDAAVGDRFVAPIEGVVHYQRGHFEVLPVSLPALDPAPGRDALPTPQRAAGRLRIASANLLNLSARNGDEKFERLARMIVRDLGSPELVALQEVQDDSGPEDDGTVGASATLAKLVQAVADAGGPDYRWTQVDPENNLEGGQPGGNIRLALLYDPRALTLPARPGSAGELPAVKVGEDGELSVNPGVLDAPAFRGNGGDDWSNSRKPLVAELRLADGYLPPGEAPDADRALYVVTVHFSSKGPDDSEWSARQPPRRRSEAQRVAQAEAVADLAQTLLAARPNARIVVIGDLNEYSFRRPVAALKEAGLTNLAEEIPADHRYTYIYRGNSILLDHVLVSPSLSQDAEIAAIHVHADQPASRQASDHDPLVASLKVR